MKVCRFNECLVTLFVCDPQDLVTDKIVDVSGFAVCILSLFISSRQLNEFLAFSIIFSKVFAGERIDYYLLINLASENALDVCVKRNTKLIGLGLEPVDISIGTLIVSLLDLKSVSSGVIVENLGLLDILCGNVTEIVAVSCKVLIVKIR